MNNLVDFHCHLDLYPDFQKVFASCEQEKIYTLAVTSTPRAWPKNRELTLNTRFVRAALGLHPQLIDTNVEEELLLWEKYFSETRFIGEVGIDGRPNFHSTLTEQKRVFERILNCCAEAGDKILSVHSTRSVNMVLNSIENILLGTKNTVVLHWFTGNEIEARRALDLGCYFSINTEMLRTKRNRYLLTELPIERILTETDGPFIKQGDKLLYPRDVVQSVKLLANLRGISIDEISYKIFANLKTLLTL